MKCRGWKNLIDGCGKIEFAIKKLVFESILNPESRAKIHFRSILWVQNPFFDLKYPVLIRKIDLLSRLWFKKIHFRSIFVGQNPFFDLRCPVLIRKIDLLSRLWFKSLRLASIYFRFLKNGLCLVYFMAV